eukprot:TRINITY_DN12195_c0_g1_i1.p1 TRINITY_DN12195_c0_g1~~TRINITY_DN12195_c0_g1_i1.p1  ORF type:complete len:588 (-),score=130.72 TRINITY_DN12195_c0_g1_i1:1313-3076(-)
MSDYNLFQSESDIFIEWCDDKTSLIEAHLLTEEDMQIIQEQIDPKLEFLNALWFCLSDEEQESYRPLYDIVLEKHQQINNVHKLPVSNRPVATPKQEQQSLLNSSNNYATTDKEVPYDDFEDIIPAITRKSLHMSRASPAIANQIRDMVASDIAVDEEREWCILDASPDWTFTLPDISTYSEEFQDKIKKDWFQTDHIRTLEESNIINWNQELTTMYPLFTTGDGNCLLHAVSLGMWGIHDRKLVLRDALNKTMKSERFRERWENIRKTSYEGLSNDIIQQRLDSEWERLNSNTSLETTIDEYGMNRFQFLDQLHVYVLAHILRRPIIVYAESVVRDPLTDMVAYTPEDKDRMDGIYLPTLWPAYACRKDPLALTFHSAHFAALVGTATEKKLIENEGEYMSISILPIMASHFELLPVHFLTDQEANNQLDIVKQYMDIGSTPSGILVARQVAGVQPEELRNLLDTYLEETGRKLEECNIQVESTWDGGPCRNNCGFQGSESTEGYCSVCYKDKLESGQLASNQTVLGSCFVDNCEFNGTDENGGYCSGCFAIFVSWNMQEIGPCKKECGFSGTLQNSGLCSVCVKS